MFDVKPCCYNHVMLQMYLDGSGKSEEINCRFLTLAGVMADSSVWAEWQDRWQTVLDEYTAPYSHMRELLRAKGTPFENWQDDRKVQFVRQLLQCFSSKDRMEMVCCSLTINLDDYRRLSLHNKKPAEAVCVDWCVTHLLAHPHFGNGTAEIFFDTGESFHKHLERTWNRNKSDDSTWAFHLKVGKSAKAVPIQAADLLAWAANRRYTAEDERMSTWRYLLDMSVLVMPRYHALYREAELRKHPGFLAWTA